MLSPGAICTVCMTGPTDEHINSSVMSSDDPFPQHFDEHRQNPKILNKPNAQRKPIAQNCQESWGRNENLF